VGKGGFSALSPVGSFGFGVIFFSRKASVSFQRVRSAGLLWVSVLQDGLFVALGEKKAIAVAA